MWIAPANFSASSTPRSTLRVLAQTADEHETASRYW